MLRLSVLALVLLGASPRVNGPALDDGTEIGCDLPTRLHVKNRGGIDGAGLCVFASMRHAGLWADDPVFAALFSFMFSKPGGGYPQKVERMVALYCQKENKPRPDFFQVEGSDLDLLSKAVEAGLMPAVTYYRSPTGRYGGKRINHMVNLVAAGPPVVGHPRQQLPRILRVDEPRGVLALLHRRHGQGLGRRPAQARPAPHPPEQRTVSLLLLILVAHQPYFGVNVTRLTGQTHYWLGGKEVPRGRIEQAVGDARVPDHAGKLHVTVIGTGRQAVLDDLAKNPALEPWRARVVARGYDPADWQVAGTGFVARGSPTIYVQDFAGRVLHRQDDYAGGAEALARALEDCQRLRKPSPDYRPDRDIDRRIVRVLPILPRVPVGAVERVGAERRGPSGVLVEEEQGMSWMTTELLHVAFAAAGGLLGWWLKPSGGLPGVPPELADLLKGVLDRQRRRVAENLLGELTDSLKQEKKP